MCCGVGGGGEPRECAAWGEGASREEVWAAGVGWDVHTGCVCVGGCATVVSRRFKLTLLCFSVSSAGSSNYILRKTGGLLWTFLSHLLS